MKRPWAIAGCVLGLVLSSPSGRRRSRSGSGIPIWVGFGPIYLAHSKGFFKAQGVDVDLQVIDDTKVGMAALAAKRIEAYGATPNTVLLYAKADNPFVMVMTVDDSKGGDGVVAKKEIKSIAELKGKRVAFLEGSIAQFYLSYLLKREGLSEKDVTAVNMGSTGDAGAAFVAGRVDAAVVWEPWLSKGKSAPDGHVLIDSSKTPGLIIDTLAFRQDVVKSRPDDVRKVVRAVGQAVRLLEDRIPKDVDRDHDEGARRLAEGAEGLRRGAVGRDALRHRGEPDLHGDEGQAGRDVPDRPGRDRFLAADREARLARGQGGGRHRPVVPGIGDS